MAQNFDQEQLEQLAGGDKVFEKELLQMFVGDTENSLQQLATAINTDNQSAVQEVAHYIKGASANVGAVAMSSVAAQLETMAKTGNLGAAAQYLRQLQVLHQDVRRLAH
ncbi:hpt domain-containing protein [Leptolyngbya sp. Heron Island J]|uniref:Hpt domain-containing protein n=1 Tax=Leptolyngbya sp. Heron Island J TaxID=1385935 RepID=UPI0003B9591C|nr:Hpt domain-containing protein [Leptolyngbya sp. Heron Island J]ESA32670.1 hpt domain-containing protein [Leptolyngbya sp. Heron Island J]